MAANVPVELVPMVMVVAVQVMVVNVLLALVPVVVVVVYVPKSSIDNEYAGGACSNISGGGCYLWCLLPPAYACRGARPLRS